VGLGHVAHINIVPHAPLVPRGPPGVEGHGLPFKDPLGEDGHHPRLPVGVLPGPVDVAVPQGDPLEAVVLPVGGEVPLKGRLAGGVGAFGPGGPGLLGGLPLGHLPVDGPAGGGEDQLLHAVPPAGLQEVHPPHQVHGEVQKGVLHAHLDRGLGRLVGDVGGAELPEDPLHPFPVPQVHLVEGNPRGDVFPLARGEVVQDRHLEALPQKGLGDVAPDEAGAARDQYAHLHLRAQARRESTTASADLDLGLVAGPPLDGAPDGRSLL